MNKILIIEDDNTVLDTLKDVLVHMGHSVETAVDGEEGISKFDEGFFDLVITDINIPGKDGNEVAGYIKNSGKPKTPVIGISGTPWIMNSIVFDSTLQKPFSLKLLMKTVNELIKAYN